MSLAAGGVAFLAEGRLGRRFSRFCLLVQGDANFLPYARFEAVGGLGRYVSFPVVDKYPGSSAISSSVRQHHLIHDRRIHPSTE
ncbi:hypothetical protein ACFP4F_09770 [Streptomyces ochraceiscleroticus]|uniref:Uncharacterized protein n=1 Tax=Streptomyces ochraceiscleroticus TaxID=47761 RepID=A0ABW1MHM4_9ACTN